MSAPTRKGFTGRIERGPMAADVLQQNFTQIYNLALRDKRLSRRARGLLAEILSHRDGYGVSMAALLANGPEGKDALTVALKELERYGYLHRERERNELGQLGDTIFKITDMPHGLLLGAAAPWEAPKDPPAEEPSSDPGAENPYQAKGSQKARSEPKTDFPAQAGPAQAQPLHKKTNSSCGAENDLSLGRSTRDAPLRTGLEGRETAAPEDTPAAAGVPAPRDGQAGGEQRPVLLEMLLGLPGRMHHDDAADLLPLVAEGLAVGWTVPRLRDHLSRRCDPDRVFDVTAIYRKHLKRLPPAPAGTGGHPVGASSACSKCNGSGLAEDPHTFLPIGPCECRQATAPTAAS
ncbi:hypothetical protein [Streptomyces sp. 900105245]